MKAYFTEASVLMSGDGETFRLLDLMRAQGLLPA